MLRVIREFMPRWVVAENVPGLLSIDAGLVFETVLSDLESEGYEVLPLHYPAAGVGAPHRRDRVFIVAHCLRAGLEGHSGNGGGRDEPGRDSAETGRSACPGGICADVADAEERRRGEGNKDAGGRGAGTGKAEERVRPSLGSWRAAKRGLGGMADEFPGWLDEPAGIPRVSTGDKNRVNRLKALGNAVVPAQAYPIFRAIAQVEKGEKP